MRNKNQIGFIIALVAMLLVAGCSTGGDRRGEVKFSGEPLPLTSLNSSLNDRSTWIDGPPAGRPERGF
jgi:hypothetical protein